MPLAGDDVSFALRRVEKVGGSIPSVSIFCPSAPFPSVAAVFCGAEAFKRLQEADRKDEGKRLCPHGAASSGDFGIFPLTFDAPTFWTVRTQMPVHSLRSRTCTSRLGKLGSP